MLKSGKVIILSFFYLIRNSEFGIRNYFWVLLQKLGSHLAPSDEGAGERSETEGEKKLRFFVALHLLSLRHGKAVPPPSSEGGENC